MDAFVLLAKLLLEVQSVCLNCSNTQFLLLADTVQLVEGFNVCS